MSLQEAFLQSVARLQQGSAAAAATLVRVACDPNATAASRVRAADSILVHARHCMTVEDFNVRLGRIEKVRKR